MEDKTLPNDNFDEGLPGRSQESDDAFYGVIEPKIESKANSKGRGLTIGIIAFVLVSAGVFSYYFVNQTQIDSEILDNTSFKSLEEKMAIKYGVGHFGSDHAHAAIAVFVNGEKLNFGLPNFQLQSKYIHFEDHNSYLIHKHATGVPLEMLFASFGLEITSRCIALSGIEYEKYCIDSTSELIFIINGNQVSDVSSYEIKHNDRILVSLGDSKYVKDQMMYLDTLKIYDVPQKNPYVPGKDVYV